MDVSYDDSQHVRTLVAIVFSHLTPAEDQYSDLADVAHLLAAADTRAHKVWLGDFNIDRLPEWESDPYADRRDRCNRHTVQRAVLWEFVEQFGLHPCEPEFSSTPDVDEWAALSLVAPFTRIPIGEQTGLASLIDLVYADHNCISSTYSIGWDHLLFDHAWISVNLSFVTEDRATRRPMRTWRPCCSVAVKAEIGRTMPVEFKSVDHFVQYALSIQESLASPTTARQRRALREPFHIKMIRHQLRNAATRADAAVLQTVL